MGWSGWDSPSLGDVLQQVHQVAGEQGAAQHSRTCAPGSRGSGHSICIRQQGSRAGCTDAAPGHQLKGADGQGRERGQGGGHVGGRGGGVGGEFGGGEGQHPKLEGLRGCQQYRTCCCRAAVLQQLAGDTPCQAARFYDRGLTGCNRGLAGWRQGARGQEVRSILRDISQPTAVGSSSFGQQQLLPVPVLQWVSGRHL